jgi:hypothetical protein
MAMSGFFRANPRLRWLGCPRSAQRSLAEIDFFL